MESDNSEAKKMNQEKFENPTAKALTDQSNQPQSMEAKPKLESAAEPGQQVSKKQQKKQLKSEMWLLQKEDLKKKRKEKRDQQKEKKRIQKRIIKEKMEKGEALAPDEINKYARPRRGRGFRQEVREKVEKAPKLILDCSFDAHHGNKELQSMGRQIERCLNLNKKFPNPLSIVATGISNKLLPVLKSK